MTLSGTRGRPRKVAVLASLAIAFALAIPARALPGAAPAQRAQVFPGAEWARWDTAISKLVTGVQNEDGSWVGHHCITGKTFCTAGALLVLMADRTPFPVDVLNKEREQKKDAKPESPTPDPAKPAAAVPVKP